MKIINPGEEELGQTGLQTLCFLTHAAQADFIAPDAMAKLRQVQNRNNQNAIYFRCGVM